MKKYFIDSYKLLKNDEKKEVTYFFILTIVSLILETLSIGALYPLLSVFVADDINDKFPFIKIILDYFNINNSSDIILIFVSIFVLLAFLIKNIFLIYFLFWHSNFYRNLRVRIKSDLLKISSELRSYAKNHPVSEQHDFDQTLLKSSPRPSRFAKPMVDIPEIVSEALYKPKATRRKKPDQNNTFSLLPWNRQK